MQEHKIKPVLLYLLKFQFLKIDRSFTFITKTPPASVLITKAAGIEKGAGESSKGSVGNISKSQLEEIAKTKLPDLNCTSIESAMKVIEGTARNMGVSITE